VVKGIIVQLSSFNKPAIVSFSALNRTRLLNRHKLRCLFLSQLTEQSYVINSIKIGLLSIVSTLGKQLDVLHSD
jgi:hypothetical protein